METKIEKGKFSKIMALLLEKKGILFATIITILFAVFGIFALFSMNSASEYQGLIKQVESTTELMTGK